MNTKGYTLIELLITVAIIGVLAGIAIPMYVGQTTKAARTEAFTNLQNIRLMQEQVFADSGSYAGPIGATGTTKAVRDSNWSSVRGVLPRFQPGPSSGLNYSYYLLLNVSMTNPSTLPWNLTTTALDPCFIAVAKGVDGTRVAGDIFAIDCNNNRNF